MQLFLRILFFLLLADQICFSQWLYQQYPINEMAEVKLISSTKGWAVGNGTIMKTEDGGISWTNQYRIKNKGFVSVDFIDQNNGWAAGSGILHTEDGGENWMLQYSTPNHYIRSIDFVDRNTGWAVGAYWENTVSHNLILNTKNGGNSWTVLFDSLTLSYNFSDAFFTDENNGWVIGSTDETYAGIILHTTNGGSDWTTQYYGAVYPLKCVFFINPDTGWVAGGITSDENSNRILLYTSDGGANWKVQLSGTEPGIKSVYFLDENYGWAVTRGTHVSNILRTTDGGSTWLPNSGNLFPLNSVYFYDQNSGCAVGGRYVGFLSEGWTYHTVNGGMNWVHTSISTNLYNVCFSDKNNGWAVGGGTFGGTILHTSDGGIHWSVQLDSLYDHLMCVYFVDKYKGWAAGHNSLIMTTSDGGESWIYLNGGINYYFWSLYFTDYNTGWIAADSSSTGIILHTSNGGTDWVRQYNVNGLIRSIFFIDENNGWAAVGNGTILRTTNGGHEWTRLGGGYGYLYSIYFIDQNNGWAAGEKILHTTNGGNSWITQYESIDKSLLSVFFVDQNNGWATGSDMFGIEGIILQTSNGGHNWERQDNGEFHAICSVNFEDANTGWAVGALGTILSTNNIVPVELTALAAKVNGNTVILNWRTSTETNNRGFDIERKKWSEIENQKWEKIGFVEGIGTTTHPHQYSYVDNNLPNGKYTYRLKQRDFDGASKYSNEVEVNVNVQLQFALGQNYPNPFNPETNIRYTIPQTALVQIKLFDILGNEIETLVKEEKPAGIYELTWNAESLPSGVYFYQLKAGNYLATKKMILLK